MRVTSSTFSETLKTQLQRLTQKQSELQNQVSSGQRITNLSDDPAAMGRVLNLEAETLQIQQFQKNNGHATQISQVTYSSVNEIKKISDRAGELGVLGAGVTNADSSTAYSAEVNQMLEQVVQTGNTKYNSQYLFGGTKTDQPPFSVERDANGKITSVTYNGAESGAAFRVGEDATISPYTSGAENQHFADFANQLVTLRNALATQDSTSLATVRTDLQTTEDNLLSTISNIGAVQTRLESNDAQNQARFASLQSLTAQDTDVDLATTMVKLSSTSTAYQAALQSGSKILQMSLLDYLR